MYYLEIHSSAPDHPLLADTQLNTPFTDETIDARRHPCTSLFFNSLLYIPMNIYISISLFSLLPTYEMHAHTKTCTRTETERGHR